ncbi:MAG: cyanophycinase [Bacteroidales bacterium]|jgi:cyanophycinase|nr:cyanophycinase [Bacteroidales bacterium]
MKKILTTLFIAFSATLWAIAQNPIVINPSTTRHGPEKGSLVIVGGGKQTDEIWDKIFELGGGKDAVRIVVVSNASGDTSANASAKLIEDLRTRIASAERVSGLNLQSIADANNPDKLVELRKATAVFFVGGRQWHISDIYLNTLAHTEFWNVLGRGGVISGSSAGASIQGSFLWRGDTSGYEVLIGDHTQGLGFLRNSAIDQHILVRNRHNDLAAFIRIAPQFIGIGIDESTAVVVQGDNVEVIGESYAAFHSADQENFVFLRKGDKYDLKNHQVVRPQRPPQPVPADNSVPQVQTAKGKTTKKRIN